MKDNNIKEKKYISNGVYNVIAIMGLAIILLNFIFTIMSCESFFNKSTLSGFMILSASILLKYYREEVK